jgi:hypothetical protein
MDLVSNSTRSFLRDKTNVAQFVNDIIPNLLHVSPLTITILPERLGDCFAITVTGALWADTGILEFLDALPTILTKERVGSFQRSGDL